MIVWMHDIQQTQKISRNQQDLLLCAPKGTKALMKDKVHGVVTDL